MDLPEGLTAILTEESFVKCRAPTAAAAKFFK